VTPCELRW